MPDIEEYDGNQYVVRPLPLRELPTISEEIFAKEFFFQELISPKQDDGSNETLSQPTFPELLGPSKDEKWPGRLSLDDYIAQLDKKIAELEAEEAATKKEENRAGTPPSEEGSKA